jgi:hypothetical protein
MRSAMVNQECRTLDRQGKPCRPLGWHRLVRPQVVLLGSQPQVDILYLIRLPPQYIFSFNTRQADCLAEQTNASMYCQYIKHLGV